ncbi:MAG: hypothetical protein AAFY74_05090 [Pseudomonadota bacterium]
MFVSKQTPLFVVGLVAIAGCATEADLSSELGIVADAAGRLETSVKSSEFEARIEADEEALDAYAYDVAVADLHRRRLSDDCADVIQRRIDDGVPDCRVIARIPEGRESPSIEPPATLALDVNRKLSGIKAYLDALDALMSSTSEADVRKSFAAATKSIAELGETAGSDAISGLVETLEATKTQREAVVSFAVQQLRTRKFRQVVLQSDDAFQEVVRETQSKLFRLGFDADYAEALRAFSGKDDEANDAYVALVVARQQGDTAAAAQAATEYRQAIVELDRAEASFKRAEDRSLTARLDALRAAHRAMAETIRNPDRVENTIALLESLRDLAKKFPD